MSEVNRPAAATGNDLPMPSPLPAPAGRARAALPVLALVVASAVSLLTGCSGVGEPQSAGRTQPASAPKRLWTTRATPPPLPEPNAKITDGVPAPVRGVPRVPSGDIHRVSALTIA